MPTPACSHRPRPSIHRRLWLGAALMLGGLLWPFTPGSAQGRATPQAPPSQPQLFDPDPGTCRPETMRAAFQRQLEPYGDQDAAVLQRLKAVQAEMTLSSLRRCVRRGLMSEEEALDVGRELGLIAPASPAVAQPRGTGDSAPSTPSTRP